MKHIVDHGRSDFRFLLRKRASAALEEATGEFEDNRISFRLSTELYL